MGDQAEYGHAMSSHSADKRADNRHSSATMLDGAGIAYERKNAGAHLIVTHGQITADFWPGTGLWHVRPQPGQQGRGVRNLIKFLRRQS